MSTFEHIIVESVGAVGIIRLNRPKMLNALSFGVFREIAAAVDDLEADDKIGCIVVTGSEKAFAAGADIKEMQPKGFIDMFAERFCRDRWRPRGALPQADHCRGFGLCARRRLRAGHDVRHHHRRRHREVRPA